MISLPTKDLIVSHAMTYALSTKYFVLIRARAQIKPEPTNLNGVFAYELQTVNAPKDAG